MDTGKGYWEGYRYWEGIPGRARVQSNRVPGVQCHGECLGGVQGADVRVPAEVEQSMGVLNSGVVYALWDYSAEFGDELSFREGEPVTVLRRQPQEELDWWWGSLYGHEGYVPRNYFGVSLGGYAKAPMAPGGPHSTHSHPIAPGGYPQHSQP